MILRWGESATSGEARTRVERVLAELGMASKADLRPSQLSGGEKQRVAIARALIKQPELCFADEPTAALDWAVGRQVADLMRRAAHERNTLMFVVAHDKRLKHYADEVYYLKDGQLTDHEPDEDEGDDAA